VRCDPFCDPHHHALLRLEQLIWLQLGLRQLQLPNPRRGRWVLKHLGRRVRGRARRPGMQSGAKTGRAVVPLLPRSALLIFNLCKNSRRLQLTTHKDFLLHRREDVVEAVRGRFHPFEMGEAKTAVVIHNHSREIFVALQQQFNWRIVLFRGENRLA
jgi:hypothetical protein